MGGVVHLVPDVSDAARLEKVRGNIGRLVANDFATVATFIDLLADSSAVSNNAELLGSVSAVKDVFVRLWNDVEAALS